MEENIQVLSFIVLFKIFAEKVLEVEENVLVQVNKGAGSIFEWKNTLIRQLRKAEFRKNLIFTKYFKL